MSGFPETADVWRSGYFWGGLWNFWGSGNHWIALIIHSESSSGEVAGELLGKCRKFWEVQGGSRSSEEVDSLPATRQNCLQRVACCRMTPLAYTTLSLPMDWGAVAEGPQRVMSACRGNISSCAAGRALHNLGQLARRTAVALLVRQLSGSLFDCSTPSASLLPFFIILFPLLLHLILSSSYFSSSPFLLA